jgi:hypothetical protein
MVPHVATAISSWRRTEARLSVEPAGPALSLSGGGLGAMLRVTLPSVRQVRNGAVMFRLRPSKCSASLDGIVDFRRLPPKNLLSS